MDSVLGSECPNAHSARRTNSVRNSLVSVWSPAPQSLLRGSCGGEKAAPVRGEPVRPRPPAPPSAARAARPLAGDGNPLLGAAQAGVPARRSGAAAPPPGAPDPRLGCPLTDRAETGLRRSSVATGVTPSSGQGSRSYSVRTRPASGWRLSPSSWLFLGPWDRKGVPGEAHQEPRLGPRGASPGRGRGLLERGHRTPACSPGTGRSHSPGPDGLARPVPPRPLLP